MRPQEPVTRAFFATKSSLTREKSQGARSGAHRLITAAALVFLAVFCLRNWFQTLAAVRGLYLEIPFGDYWRVAYHLREIQNLDFRYFWQQHNEHRIVFPDAVFALDALLFHMRRILPIVLSCLIYIASWHLLVYPVARDSRLTWADRVALVLITGGVVGWKGAALSLADPFLVDWSLLSFAALLSLSFLTSKSNLRMALVISCAVVATYSSGSGLLLWPVLWMLGRLLKLGARQYSALVVSGCVSIAIYFLGYRVSDTSSIGNLLHHPFYVIGFVAMYLSMPFGGMKSPHFGLYIGAGALMLFLFVAPFIVRSRSRVGIVAGGWYLFVLLSGVIIAAGRMDPADPTFTAAKASRYLIPVVLAWGALFAMLLWTAAIRRWRLASPLVASVLLAVVLLISDRKLSWWWTMNLRPYISAQITEVSLENDVFDPELVRNIFPDPEFVAHYLAELKQSRLSIYSEVRELGQTARLSNPNREQIIRTIPVASGLEVIGRSSLSAPRVLLVGDPNIIIGTGRPLPFGLPSELMPPDTKAARAWIAFVPERYARQSFWAFAIDMDP